MGNSLGRRAQARMDQLSLWDDVFADSSSAPAVVARADALPDGAVVVSVDDQPVPAVVDQPESAVVDRPGAAVVNLPRSHCPAGHPYDADNTYVSRQGWRSCRTCKRLSDRRRRARTAKNLTPEERTLRARMGAYRLHALYDPKETTNACNPCRRRPGSADGPGRADQRCRRPPARFWSVFDVGVAL